MRDQLLSIQRPVPFLDDWPQQPKSAKESYFEAPGLTTVKRWRLQTLLAVNPWGIPSVAFATAYKDMFSKELDFEDFGFKNLSDMVSNLPEIFTVQEPDDLTTLMFPDYPQDKILHDARFEYDFLNTDNKAFDPDILVATAWLNRDCDFPCDVVLPGEEYNELILPLTAANIPGTRGVHQVVMVGAANPNHFHVNIKSDCLDRLAALSLDVKDYFEDCGKSLEMYQVPDEFLYPGFACLVYLPKQKVWERCSIVGRGSKVNKVLAESVDYGGVLSINRAYLYLMPKKFFELPKQAVAVSLIGMDPVKDSKWPSSAGVRMRCFSSKEYWLDAVLVEPKNSSKELMREEIICDDKSVTSSENSDEKPKGQSSTAYRKRRRQLQFEVLICDRNDDEIDIYLDDILLMEQHATLDNSRANEITDLKDKLSDALRNIPRPINPFCTIDNS